MLQLETCCVLVMYKKESFVENSYPQLQCSRSEVLQNACRPQYFIFNSLLRNPRGKFFHNVLIKLNHFYSEKKKNQLPYIDDLFTTLDSLKHRIERMQKVVRLLADLKDELIEDDVVH